MKGNEELIFGIRAGYSYFYAQSEEINKTTMEISLALEQYAKEYKIACPVSIWDFETEEDGQSKYNNPDDLFPMIESAESGSVFIAKNFVWFLADNYGSFDKAKTSWLLNRANKFSMTESRKVLIIVGHEAFDKAIPDILKRDFAKIEFPLPDEKEIEKIYLSIVESAKENPKFVMPTESEKQRIITGAKGLTNSEIVKVFSYTIIKGSGIFDPKTVEELRAEEINSTPGLTIGKYNKSLDDLKGFEIAKEIVDEWIEDPESKGIILLGPAGVGKTHFCQAIAGHYNRLVIELEFAQLMGDGLVGQAEKAMKRALEVIAANANPSAPIILFCDELEKGLAGTSSVGKSGSNDGGTTDRSNSQFLKFLSDARPKGVYVIATCNDIERLPSHFIRTGRFDCSPLFVDLPNKDEQEAILSHYQKTYGINDRPKNMADWTGSEIQAWCKLAAKKISRGKSASEADELIVPISKTMNKEIDYLRTWSKGRTIPASRKISKEEKSQTRSLTL